MGENIRKFRNAAGITQADLAEKCGLTRTGLGDIERGKYNPSSMTLKRISEVLSIPMEDFFKPDK